MPGVIKNLFHNSLALLSKKQNSILTAAAIIMVTVLLSRILGLVRDRLLATYFTVDELGVYFAAFRLPNLIFELLVMGALSTAFIPVFSRILVSENRDKAFSIAANIINLSIVAVIVLSIPLLVFTYPLSFLLVPKFSESERQIMVAFTRIMLIGQLLPLIVGNFVTGMLQSLQRFVIPALAPVVYNVGIICGILFLSPIMGLSGAVWGVVIGAVFFLLIQIPLIISFGYKHNWKFNIYHPSVKEIIRLMLPRSFGMGVAQIDTTVDLILASFLGTRSITIFQFAQHLQQLPIGLFGATFAQAALPTLSSAAAQKDQQLFKQIILASMHQTLFFTLPASVMLIVLRTPLVRLIFGAARFDWLATVATGKTLSFFAVSIFAQSLVQLYARAFYAIHDTKTPVIVGLISVIINTLLSCLFVLWLKYPVWALAISASIASLINALLLFILLYTRISGFSLRSLVIPPIKMVVASLVTGIFLYVPIKLLDQLVFDTTRVFDLLLLTGVASISGLSVYIFLAWFLDIEEVATFFKFLQKVKQAPKLLFTRSEELVESETTAIP